MAEIRSQPGLYNTYGTDDDDVIYASDDGNQLFGYKGNDTLIGGKSGDSLIGHEGDDTLYGNGGNDTLQGVGGTNQLYGGDGNDELYVSSVTNSVTVSLAGSMFDGGAGDDTFTIFSTRNVTYDTTGAVLTGLERLKAEYTNNVNNLIITPEQFSQFKSIYVGRVLDVHFSQPGVLNLIDVPSQGYLRYTLTGSYNSFKLSSGYFAATADTPAYAYGGTIYGSDTGADEISGGAQTTIYGFGGNDILSAWVGATPGIVPRAEIYGGAGSDKITGGLGDDALYGDGDSLSDESGIDEIRGGGGNDAITDTPFDSVNWVVGGTIDGADGIDTVTFRTFGGYGPDAPHATFLSLKNAAGQVIWQQGGPGIFDLDGAPVTAQFAISNNSRTVTGDVSLVNVEKIAGVTAGSPLFTEQGETIDFRNLSPDAQAAALSLAGANRTDAIYNALGGNDTVVLPDRGTEIASGYKWDFTQTFFGGAGNDTVTTGTGDDIVNGGADNDRIVGSAGTDTLMAGPGDDTLDYQALDLTKLNGSSSQILQGGSGSDVLQLPGSPSDYVFTTAGADTLIVDRVATAGRLVLDAIGIEAATFKSGIANAVSRVQGAQDLIGEMVRLSVAAYSNTPGALNLGGWHAVAAIELGMTPVATDQSIAYTFADGLYSAIDSAGSSSIANALVLTGVVDDVKTLVLDFRGTDDLATDFSDYLPFTKHYAKFGPLIAKIDAYVQANGIGSVLVTGHSLGGAMVQEFMAGHTGDLYRGVTVGSPGGNTAAPDARIVNFVHFSDPVPLTVLANSASQRDGGEVRILNTTSYGLGAHDKQLYQASVLKLSQFAEDASSGFYASALAATLRAGTPFAGDVQVSVGSPFLVAGIMLDEGALVATRASDNYVLGNASGNKITWSGGAPTADGSICLIDGSGGLDTLVLGGLSYNWSWEALGSAGTYTLRYKGAAVAELHGVEKLSFTFSDAKLSGSTSGMALQRSAQFAFASVPASDVPVAYLDGTTLRVQTSAAGQVDVQADGVSDYLQVAAGTVHVAGSAADDVVVLGAGRQTIESGAGSDIIVAKAAEGIYLVTGGSGDDVIKGAGNSVTAAFGGRRTDYLASAEEDGTILVHDMRAGSPDGTDQLEGVASFRFAGGTFTAAQLLSGSPTTPAADFDGNGHSDILWRETGGTFSTWGVSGDPGNQFAVNSTFVGGVGSDWKIQETFDWDGDGRSDILWRNQNSGEFTVWTGKGDGWGVNAFDQVGVGTNWKIAGVGDLDGDGKDDIVWREGNGAFSTWQSTGTGFNVNVDFDTSVSPDWQIVGLADFDGDGKDDLLWRNQQSGAFSTWTSNGTGFAPNTNFITSVDTTWHIDGLADFNGDGRDDILWRHDGDGAFSVWQANASGGFTPNTYFNTSVAPVWQVQTTGDYNDDGRADILWRNTADGTFSTWQSNGNGFDPNTAYVSGVGTNWQVQGHNFQFG